MKIYLITGVAGFIGSNLAEEILKIPENIVIGIDNFYSGYSHNLETLKSNNFIFYECDICNYSSLKNIFESYKIDFILHQAAVASVQSSIENPIFSNNVNVIGTLNLLTHAKNFKIKRFVFASSAAVYGRESGLPKNESSIAKPISPYGYEKLICENYLDLFSDLYGLETIKLRYFNVYGPRQDPTSEYSGVISIFDNLFSIKKRPVIFGDGGQSRDFIHVEDIVKVNMIASQCQYSTENRLICCGSGNKTSINELFDMMCKKHNIYYEKKYLDSRVGDIYSSISDNSKMMELINYSQLIKFEDGLLNLG